VIYIYGGGNDILVGYINIYISDGPCNNDNNNNNNKIIKIKKIPPQSQSQSLLPLWVVVPPIYIYPRVRVRE